MTATKDRVRIVDSTVLSDDWYTLKKVTFDFLRRDGTWQRQSRETYDRGNGATILLVEQNARAGLKFSNYGVVMENGTVRLSGTGREVLEHPEIGELYLGGAVKSA